MLPLLDRRDPLLEAPVVVVVFLATAHQMNQQHLEAVATPVAQLEPLLLLPLEKKKMVQREVKLILTGVDH